MRKLLFAAALGVVLWAMVVVPLPLASLAPVRAMPVADVVDVGPELADDVPQELLFTAVRIEQPTTIGAIVVLLDESRDLSLLHGIVPPGIDEQRFAELQQRLFRESVRAAAAVGLRAAGRDVTVSGDGARVVATVPGTPAEDVLRPDDVVVAVDGEPLELASELASRLSGQQAGEQVELTVRRDGEERTERLTLAPLSRTGQAGIGVAVTTVDLQIDLPVEVEAAADTQVGGPSAGLMIALSVHDAATEGSLTGGRTVAGTGTMDVSGRVGRVGGIAEKVRGAVLAGADVFLVPEGALDDARRAAPDDLEVVPVATLDDAITALAGSG